MNDDLSFQKPKAYTFTEDYLSKSSKSKQKAKAKRIDRLKISFSNDGKLFVLYSKESNFIKVFKLPSIDNLLSVIEENNPLVEERYGDESKDHVEKVAFGERSKYMVVQYTQKINIYNIYKMMAQGDDYAPKEFVIPTDQYEKICDYFFKPNVENEKYTCYIACKV